ncbi:hypothetical protein VP01_362g4 [Puccinia sorghi]|uniref:Uncharacterized protein n=1 Tax=Puccinia sorghi TaxID=27349 RepID=A0A0L6UVH6_9BASI|nr:hypothetical protein VP01_362g4 [Puccinia sorghi]
MNYNIIKCEDYLQLLIPRHQPWQNHLKCSGAVKISHVSIETSAKEDLEVLDHLFLGGGFYFLAAKDKPKSIATNNISNGKDGPALSLGFETIFLVCGIPLRVDALNLRWFGTGFWLKVESKLKFSDTFVGVTLGVDTGGCHKSSNINGGTDSTAKFNPWSQWIVTSQTPWIRIISCILNEFFFQDLPTLVGFSLYLFDVQAHDLMAVNFRSVLLGLVCSMAFPVQNKSLTLGKIPQCCASKPAKIPHSCLYKPLLSTITLLLWSIYSIISSPTLYFTMIVTLTYTTTTLIFLNNKIYHIFIRPLVQAMVDSYYLNDLCSIPG